MTSVLHLIASLSRGGPGHALVTAAAASAGAAELDHIVASLREPDPSMVAQARGRGLDVCGALDRTSLRGMMDAADVVQVHFWNSPELYQLLGSDLPEMRLLVWSHVAGQHPPQVLLTELLGFADTVLASCAHTTGLPGLESLDVIPAVAGWDRVQDVEPDGHREFTVGYIGKLDFAKLHPEFATMCAAIRAPGARFVICGTGGALPTLRRQAAENGIEDRLELRGFVDDIRAVIGEMDVFGYPLAESTSAASELALQEVMYAGVPPVVLGSRAVCRNVIHGETGLVADSPSEYVRAVTYLHDHPEERVRLGRAAHEYAARTWSPETVADRWAQTYRRLMERPKRLRPRYSLGPGGAARFVESLGDSAPQFLVSLTSTGDEALVSERQIANSPGTLCTGDGGILHYRDCYPDDPHLRLWAGLILVRQGRPALAAGEFAAAIRLGLDHWRLRWYLAVAAQGAGASAVVEQALASVPSPVSPLAAGVLVSTPVV